MTCCSISSTVEAAGRHRDPHRIARMRGGELRDVGRHGRREEQRLARLRQQRDDLPHVADEAHVEHPVGLVEDEDLDAVEPDMALPDQVEQPPRRRHQDVDARAPAPRPAALGRRRRRSTVARSRSGGRRRESSRRSGRRARGSGSAPGSARSCARAPAAPAGGDRPKDAAGSAARRRRSCRCRSGRCPAGRGRRGHAGSPAPGSGSARRSPPRRARGKSARRVPGLEIQSRILILSGSTAGQDGVRPELRMRRTGDVGG